MKARTAAMIVDCHVNVYEDSQMLSLHTTSTAHARPGELSPRSDPDTVYAAMKDVDKAIVFSLRYKDSVGIDGDDEVTARAVAKYPDKLVGFACVDPRRWKGPTRRASRRRRWTISCTPIPSSIGGMAAIPANKMRPSRTTTAQ